MNVPSKIDPSRYANTGFSIADTPPELNALLSQKMMAKTGPERLALGCQLTDTARHLVWSNIPKNLPQQTRNQLFLEQFCGNHPNRSTFAAIIEPTTHLSRQKNAAEAKAALGISN